MAAMAVAGGICGLVPDWLQINVPGASKQMKGTFGHRGFSHWLWTPLALAFLMQGILDEAIIQAGVGGWLSHILLDALAGGVPAVWPFGRWTWGHVKTGGKVDRFTGGAALVVSALLVLATLL